MTNSRNCYCPTDGVQPQWLIEENIPFGFCGKCEECGALGHLQHYPGPVPYTGAWCDACYEIEAARGDKMYEELEKGEPSDDEDDESSDKKDE